MRRQPLTVEYDSASAINYATVLGGAVDYGIVAEKLAQNGHMETTFATNTFEWSGNSNDVDFMHDKTAHFIVGKDITSYMCLGPTYASSLYIW